MRRCLVEAAKLVCDILMVVIAALTAWISIRTWRGNMKFEKYRMIRDYNLRNFTTGIKTFFPYADLVEYRKSKRILDDTFFNAELGVKKFGKNLNW